jgi:hypothetical protein
VRPPDNGSKTTARGKCDGRIFKRDADRGIISPCADVAPGEKVPHRITPDAKAEAVTRVIAAETARDGMAIAKAGTADGEIAMGTGPGEAPDGARDPGGAWVAAGGTAAAGKVVMAGMAKKAGKAGDRGKSGTGARPGAGGAGLPRPAR